MKLNFAVLLLVCWVFSSASGSSFVDRHEEKIPPASRAICLVCEAGCTTVGVSKPFSPLVPSDLSLATGIATVTGALGNGDEAAIEEVKGPAQQAFEIINVASQIATGIYNSVVLTQAIEDFERDLDSLAREVDNLGDLIAISTIYNQFNDERLNIEYQVYSLHRYLTAAPENQESLKTEFLSAFETSNYNQNMFNLYMGLNTILTATLDSTGSYRRLIADMGNDIVQHIIGGTGAYYAYNYFKCLCADCVIDEWNGLIVSAQQSVSNFESKCVDNMKNGGAYNDLINSNNYCPSGSNYDYALSVYNAFSDKYDWLKWDVTTYEQPHGSNSHIDDERGGDQYFIAEGVNGKTVTVMYMDINKPDVTDVALINDAMAHRPGDDNCDEQYAFLRSYGVQGSLLCCRDEWNVVNIPDNLGLFGPYNGGANIFYLACLYY